MKKITSLFFLASGMMLGQTVHSVTLTWTDTLNPAGTTYSIYRAPGMCSGSPVFAKLAAAIAVKSYKDDTVTPGNYCYQATATLNGMESAPSNTARRRSSLLKPS